MRYWQPWLAAGLMLLLLALTAGTEAGEIVEVYLPDGTVAIGEVVGKPKPVYLPEPTEAERDEWAIMAVSQRRNLDKAKADLAAIVERVKRSSHERLAYRPAVQRDACACCP